MRRTKHFVLEHLAAHRASDPNLRVQLMSGIDRDVFQGQQDCLVKCFRTPAEQQAYMQTRPYLAIPVKGKQRVYDRIAGKYRKVRDVCRVYTLVG